MIQVGLAYKYYLFSTALEVLDKPNNENLFTLRLSTRQEGYPSIVKPIFFRHRGWEIPVPPIFLQVDSIKQ